MYRPASASQSYSHRWQETCARLLAFLTLWICVSVSLQYVYYGNQNLVLGPNSSRLLKASSIFVKQIQVRDDTGKGFFLYGFSEKPKLSLETVWNVSKHLIVRSSYRQGFSLWLNKGSRIHVRREVSSSNLSDVLVILTKGEQNFKTLQPYSTNSFALSNSTNGNGQAKYTIEEDDSYFVSIVNMKPTSIKMALNINVSSKIYDTTKAESNCSTINGLCRLKLPFPRTQFVILTTPDNGDLSSDWSSGLSFVARMVTYIAILGFVAVVIFLILKYFGACDGETTVENRIEVEEIYETETNPLLSEKTIRFVYGTDEEDPEARICSSSEDLYDGKICAICYDEPRNCFFVPCGHCATCFACAQRIVDGENKVCPICRGFILKVRRVISP